MVINLIYLHLHTVGANCGQFDYDIGFVGYGFSLVLAPHLMNCPKLDDLGFTWLLQVHQRHFLGRKHVSSSSNSESLVAGCQLRSPG
jgi:hypothetical protein